MKTFKVLIVLMTITKFCIAQDPCYIKYTYDASGNRIKREFICAQFEVEPVNGGGTSGTTTTNCCPSPKISKSNKVNQANFDFSISPNPAITEVLITLSTTNSNLIKGFIFSSLGQEVLKFDLNSNAISIDFSNFTSGIYYVVLQKDKQKVIKKLTKVN
jgi:hypothetical protein